MRTLYARRRTRTSVAAARGPGARSCRASALEGSVIVSFKTREGGIQHFPARHDYHVVAGRNLVAPEDLARQTLGAIAHDGPAKLARSSDAAPLCLPPVREHEHRHEPAGDARAVVIDAFELGSAADSLFGREAFPAHSSATVSRFRPFARRRLSTIRPFLVAIRTRKPCVFFRRRVFG
jgi:hypothetical protein